MGWMEGQSFQTLVRAHLSGIDNIEDIESFEPKEAPQKTPDRTTSADAKA